MKIKRIFLLLSLALCLVLASCAGAKTTEGGEETKNPNLLSTYGGDEYEMMLGIKALTREFELEPTVAREVNNIIAQNIEGCGWDESTMCSGARPYKNPELDYCGFYVELVTKNKASGYILLSFFESGAMFTDSYSFTERLEIPELDTENELVYIGGGELIKYNKTSSDAKHSSFTSDKEYTLEEMKNAFGDFRAEYEEKYIGGEILKGDDPREFDCYSVVKAFITQRAAEEGSTWSDKTRYSGGIVLYSPDKKYCGFHFDLETDDKPTGYIRVLFFDDGFPYVEGYSEESIDIGFTPNPTMYIGNGEYIRKKDGEDFFRSTKTAATYTEEEVRAQFEALKNSNSN